MVPLLIVCPEYKFVRNTTGSYLEGAAMSSRYLGKIETFIKPWLEKEGFTLITSEFTEEDHNWYLRLYIDLTEEERAKREEELKEAEEKPEMDEEGTLPGIGINDCVKVSRYLSKWLDKEDFIKEVYTLEVCSRGFLKPAEDEDSGDNQSEGESV